MTSSVVLSNELFAVLDCQPALNATVPMSPTAGEAGKAFADMPAMAEFRRQSRANRTESSDASLECECGDQQASVHESPPPQDPPRPETPAATQECAEDVAREGEADVSTSGRPQCATATAADGSTAQTASQSPSEKDGSVSTGGSVLPGDPVPVAEKPADALKAALLADGGGNEKAPGQTGVSAATTLASGPNAVTADATAAAGEYRTAGSVISDGHAGTDRAVVTAALALGQTQADQASAGQQQQGENANGPLTGTEANARSENAGSPSASHVQEIIAAGLANAEPLSETRGQAVMQPEPLAPLPTDNTPDSGSLPAHSGSSSLAETTLERTPVGTLGAQILDYVHASLAREDKQLLIRLDPPELGNVTMRFQEQRGLIEGVLEVSKDQTRWELEEALPQALRSLQEAGIQIRRLDVMVSDQSEKEPQREQWGQDGSTQQQGSDQREAPSEHMTTGPWRRWTFEEDRYAMGREAGTTPKMDAADNRINMLA